jgi:thiamine-monophosphate kinase
MRVADLGEFGLIELLTRQLGITYPPASGTPPRPGLLVDLGDDAVVTKRRDAATIWTTDTMVEGIHFLADRIAWQDIGWKSLAVNISDIAAMGGTPDLALVTLSLPPEFLVDDAIALYQGINEAAKAYNITLGGGDIVRSPVFAVTVALSGIAETPKLGETVTMTRSAARIGDVVAISGNVGDSAGGFRLIASASASNREAARYLRMAHARPEPRIALGKAAVEAGVRCAIDVSDGLLQDLGHLARASNAAIRIDANRVPVSDALNEVFAGQALGIALSGGEDYELILIAPRPIIEALIDRSEVPLTEIGEVVHHPDAPRVAVVDETGMEIPLGEQGWDHFRTS